MDLIYATDEKIDIGIMQDFTFDLAFGSDENDFELTNNIIIMYVNRDILYTLKTQNTAGSLIRLKSKRNPTF